MNSILRHCATCAALAVALALTGTALAAPPEAPPGLETAPGQEKKAEEAAPAPAPAAAPAAPAATSAPAKDSAPGQVKKTSTAASSTKSSGINSTSSGVKPSNSTKKHTSCTTGGAMPNPSCTATAGGTVSDGATSDRSKRYGNGTTAAQGVVSRGGVGVEIRGPGNSQPHKVCKKVNSNGKQVWSDWHSVKTYATVCVAATSVQAPVVVRAPGLGPTTVTGAPAVAPAAAAAAAAAAAPAAAAAARAAGGVAGVTATRPEAGGVAGALAEIGGVAGQSLPFTGVPLFAVVVVAIAAIAIGLVLRRSGRTLPTPV
jgi:DNA polymerase-3 subunit gamma/tau